VWSWCEMGTLWPVEAILFVSFGFFQKGFGIKMCPGGRLLARLELRVAACGGFDDVLCGLDGYGCI
jgi:hypothetical protein